MNTIEISERFANLLSVTISDIRKYGKTSLWYEYNKRLFILKLEQKDVITKNW